MGEDRQATYYLPTMQMRHLIQSGTVNHCSHFTMAAYSERFVCIFSAVGFTSADGAEDGLLAASGAPLQGLQAGPQLQTSPVGHQRLLQLPVRVESVSQRQPGCGQ